MHAIVILKQVDALNGADENLDGHACKHRPKMYVCFACKKLPWGFTSLCLLLLHRGAFTATSFYMEGSNL
jgi:hypothetical protein